jgi:hypothetical protein
MLYLNGTGFSVISIEKHMCRIMDLAADGDPSCHGWSIFIPPTLQQLSHDSVVKTFAGSGAKCSYLECFRYVLHDLVKKFPSSLIPFT